MYNKWSITDVKKLLKENFAGDRPARSFKPGRNDPCPCGSGQKYKKCCNRVRAETEEGHYINALEKLLYETSDDLRNNDAAKIKNAINSLEAALKDYPLHVGFLELLIASYLAISRKKEAEKNLDRLWRLQGPQMRDKMLKGYCKLLFNSLRWPQLEEVFQQSENLEQESSLLTAYHSILLLQRGKTSKAEEILGQALDSYQLTREDKRKLLDTLRELDYPQLALKMYVEKWEEKEETFPEAEEYFSHFSSQPEPKKDLKKIFADIFSPSSSLQQRGADLLEMLKVVEKAEAEELSAVYQSPAFQSEDVQARLNSRLWMLPDNYPAEVGEHMLRVDEKLKQEMLTADIEMVLEEIRQESDESIILTAIKAASQRPREVTPHLLSILEETAAQLDEYKYSNSDQIPDISMLPIYALFLLADFGEEKAFPLTLDIISHPGEVVDPVLGDVLSEDIARVLLSTYNGNLEALKEVIENEDIYYSSRTTAMDALVMLVSQGRLDREEVKDYFAYLYREGLKREKDSFVWGMLVVETKTLRLEELKPQAEMAYEKGYISEYVFPPEENLDKIDENKEEHLTKFFNQKGIFERYSPITDGAELAKKWLS